MCGYNRIKTYNILTTQLHKATDESKHDISQHNTKCFPLGLTHRQKQTKNVAQPPRQI